jgi:hypothetical protein
VHFATPESSSLLSITPNCFGQQFSDVRASGDRCGNIHPLTHRHRQETSCRPDNENLLLAGEIIRPESCVSSCCSYCSRGTFPAKQSAHSIPLRSYRSSLQTCMPCTSRTDNVCQTCMPCSCSVDMHALHLQVQGISCH